MRWRFGLTANTVRKLVAEDDSCLTTHVEIARGEDDLCFEDIKR